MTIRVGLGFDSHPRSAGRELYLGGVLFQDEDGLDGHSDADVVCHALGDAVLGAAGLGDIGEHFPEDDPSFTGMAGTDLLAGVLAIVGGRGCRISSVDVVVVAERPAIGPRRQEMREAVARALGLNPEAVSVKATRPEGLSLRGDGVACMAVAVVDAP